MADEEEISEQGFEQDEEDEAFEVDFEEAQQQVNT